MRASSIGPNKVNHNKNKLLIMSTINVATGNLFGQMEVRSKDTGSMDKPVVLECSEPTLMKSLKAFGSKTDRLICVYLDKVTDRICLPNRQLLEWAVWTLTHQVCKRNRMAKASKCGAMEATTSVTS